MSLVRPGVGALSRVLLGSEMLLSALSPSSTLVAQLPSVAGEKWLALPFGASVPEAELSIAAASSGAIDFSRPLSGLFCDAWPEAVPSREETTAITFQYNPPDACAPQAMLLAVPPVPDVDWTIGTLHRVLAETLDLAKLRAVDSDALADCGQFLPALCFAFNAKDDAVSTDFAPLTR